MIVVCFGLNDASQGVEGIEKYKNALAQIFAKVKETDTEIIFMTPNMVNTYTSSLVPEGLCKDVAEMMSQIQNQGIMDLYMDAAREVCAEYGVKLCDCYGKWKLLAEKGVDTIALLSNHINHPTREMSWLFAGSLVECMFQND